MSRRPGGRPLLLLAAVVAAGCASFPRAADEGGPPWIQVATEHFQLATDMEQGPAEEVSVMLENWWQAMQGVMARQYDLGAGADDAPAADPDPLLVIALRSRGEREEVHYILGGVFRSFDYAPPVIDVGDIDDDEGRETLRHELAHALLNDRLPRVPHWLNEGMAEYLQTADVDTRGHLLTWGARSSPATRNYVEWGTRVGPDALFNPDRWSGPDLGALEFYAGLFVHMLANRHPSELTCYLRGLKTDIDVDAPFKTCFSGRDKWNAELNDYSFTTFFKTQSIPFAPPPVHPRTSPLGDARVHAVLGLLDIASLDFDEARFRPPRVERSQQHLRRALELEPGQLLAGLLTLELGDLDPRAYAALSAAIVSNHPVQWRGWVARANTPHLPPAEQKQAIDRAWKLAPHEREVLRFAAALAAAEGRWSDARELGLKAWLKGASSLSDRANLAIASAELGRCPESHAWAPTAVADKTKFKAEVAKRRGGAKLPPSACDVAAGTK